MGWMLLVHTLLLTATGYSLTLLLASLFRRLIKPNAKDEPEDTAGASNVHAMARAAGRELPLAAE